MLRARTYDTPLVPMRAVASPAGLVALAFAAPDDDLAWIAKRFGAEAATPGDAPAFAPLAAWLDAYFAGQPAAPATVPLDLRGTPFERQVWQALLALPPGRTTTYGALAAGLGLAKGAARAVGGAVGRNPLGVIVPCHRVVGADGTLTGYAGGLPRKRWLLHHEGVLLAP